MHCEIAYALFKLGVFFSSDAARQALDMAGEAIFRRRSREHKPSPRVGLCYPKAKVYTAGDDDALDLLTCEMQVGLALVWLLDPS